MILIIVFRKLTINHISDYDCSSSATNQQVTAANQTGQFRVLGRNEFGKCNLTLKAQPHVGLYFNFTITDFTAYGSDSSLVIIPDGSSDSYNVTGNQQINGIRTQIVDIVPKGQLKFTISYIALDVCGGFNCGSGTCFAGQGNQPNCKCDSCYETDEDGRCTIRKFSQLRYYYIDTVWSDILISLGNYEI